jgi:hypothetical protein
MLLVEHGETTDPVTQLIDDAFFAKDATVENYDLAVDVTEEEANFFFPGDLLSTIIGRNNPAPVIPVNAMFVAAGRGWDGNG